MAIDFEAEGLLEGLEGPAREARLALLERFESDGYGLEELRTATQEGRLPLLAVERAVAGGEDRYTATEVSECSGLDPVFLDRLWRALGMALADPDERTFTEADMEAAVRTKALRDAGLSDESIIEIGRVMARGTFGIASAVGRVFTETFIEPGDDEQTLALRYAEASRELTPMLGPVIEHVLGVQQRSLIRQAAVDLSTLETGRLPQGQQVSIAFADLVGFTRLGENLDPAELGAVAERLETLGLDVAEPPVRLIKTIGDAVMLESADTDALLGATLALVDAAEEAGDDLPALRAGVARGEALERAGDWFGRPVNLASRIADVARPGSLLVEAAAKGDADETAWRFSAAGKRSLKGVKGSVSLHRARRREAEEKQS